MSLRGIVITAHLVGTHRLLISDGGGGGGGGSGSARLFNQSPAVNRFGFAALLQKKKKGSLQG